MKILAALLSLIILFNSWVQARDKSAQFSKYVLLTIADHELLSRDEHHVVVQILTRSNTFEIRLTKEETSFNFEMDYYVGFVITTENDVMREGHAYGVLNENGFFRGTFELNDDKYYVEDAKRYFDHVESDVIGILYKSSDVHSDESELNDEFKMDRPPSEVSTRFGDQFIENGPFCVLNIEVDKSLYYSFNRNIQDIKQFVFMTVLGANKIYREAGLITIDGQPIQFVVGRLQVHTPQSCNSSSEGTYRCANEESLEPKAFIEDFSFSKSPHVDYCLSYIFSAQDFGATLGIAYVGGVCEPQISVGQRNYNVGFITTAGFRTQFQTELTLAHELGHSLGSAHDSFKDGCLDPRFMEYPGYNLMSPIAPNVEKKNSRRFSRCSKRDIDAVLSEMQLALRRNCLVKEPEPLITSIEDSPDFSSGAKLSIASPAVVIILSSAFWRLLSSNI